MTITVCTPTYNRLHTLPRLYQSLCAQQRLPDEWLVVDDGSTDGTTEWLRDIAATAPFAVRVIAKPNGGKHTALNAGAQAAAGDWFFIVDSDDQLPPTALQWLADVGPHALADPDVWGIMAQKATPDGRPLGHEHIAEASKVDYFDFVYRQGGTGDHAEILKTAILRQNPFPAFDGERFCSEAVLWRRLGAKYKFWYYPTVVYHAEYLGDGLSQAVLRNKLRSPLTHRLEALEKSRYAAVPLKERLRAAANYWRFHLTAGGKWPSGLRHAGPLGWAMLPVGCLLYRKTKGATDSK